MKMYCLFDFRAEEFVGVPFFASSDAEASMMRNSKKLHPDIGVKRIGSFSNDCLNPVLTCNPEEVPFNAYLMEDEENE